MNYQQCKAWPFQEARPLLARKKDTIIFETGYGPSGLPHLGTFAEVLRTSMVKHAFSLMAPEVKTKLIVFSDDMDGLRKVPENVPKQDILAKYINQPLSRVPDPFDKYQSFAEHNNNRLCSFLDQYNFDYEFVSSTKQYSSGVFDETMLKILNHYQDIMDFILPTLRKERQQTYSPFLPICPKTGEVLMVPMVEVNPEAGTVVYEQDGKLQEVKVTGGNCKLQWKIDWGMRWAALGVDYEMSGKDHIDNANLSKKVCRTIGATPPIGFHYELFLDEQGEKISKSRGNGLSMEDWLSYGTKDSLALFLFNKPRTAKRIGYSIIPQAIEDTQRFLENYNNESQERKAENPVFHIYGGKPPVVQETISFSLLLNLVNACNTEDDNVLWGYINTIVKGASASTHPLLAEYLLKAKNYFKDHIAPKRKFKTPTDLDKISLTELLQELSALPKDASASEIQQVVYDVGKKHDYPSLKDWFQALYAIHLGQNHGPRFGSFVALYGIDNTISLIESALQRD